MDLQVRHCVQAASKTWTIIDICLPSHFFFLPTLAGGCTDGDVRLEDGDRKYEDRIELCYRGKWGTVCDKGTTNYAARVVCTQQKLPFNGEYNYFLPPIM